MLRTLVQFGIDGSPEEDTPLVRRLLATIEQQQETIKRLEATVIELKAEINRMKGLPELPQRSVSPSSLTDPTTPPSKNGKGKTSTTRRGKNRKKLRRKNNKGSKLSKLTIDQTKIIDLDTIPAGAKRKGFKSFIIQELEVKKVTTRYRRAVYELPDGSITLAPRPQGLTGQFGPQLRCFILHQYYQNHVTENLIHKQLAEFGVSISAGQISNILTLGHDEFHQEKESLLPAAREVSTYFHTDDTTARHQGQSGHTSHIGNQFFASFSTTASKSRINFLEILRCPHEEYVLDGDAFFYLEYHKFPQVHLETLRHHIGESVIWKSFEEFQSDLKVWGFTEPAQVNRLTEAALWGCLMKHDLYTHQPFISDDAAQFKLLWVEHSLCWLHAERHVARLIPLTISQRRAYDKTRDAIWRFYRRLEAYRQSPNQRKHRALERDFDRLFQTKTGWPELNEALQKIHTKRDGLLLVLEHPEIPLTNNLSENDIRQFAKIRKISGSTRSDNGRRCRDTFISLKTTCRKLGISFWQFLQDRICGTRSIPPLPELIRQAAA